MNAGKASETGPELGRGSAQVYAVDQIQLLLWTCTGNFIYARLGVVMWQGREQNLSALADTKCLDQYREVSFHCRVCRMLCLTTFTMSDTGRLMCLI